MFWRNRKAEELAALMAEVRVLQNAVAAIALRLEAIEQRPRVAIPLERVALPRGGEVNGFKPGAT